MNEGEPPPSNSETPSMTSLSSSSASYEAVWRWAMVQFLGAFARFRLILGVRRGGR